MFPIRVAAVLRAEGGREPRASRPRTLKATAGQSGGCRLLGEEFPILSAPAPGEKEAPTCPAP